MHTRRFTALLLGLWLGASLLVDWTAASVSANVEASLARTRERDPNMVKAIGEGLVRDLFRYQTVEIKRINFYAWGFAQTAFSAVFLVVVLFATNGNKLAVGFAAVMAILTAGMTFGVLPSMLERSRAIDFAEEQERKDEVAVFTGYHNTYIGMEILKLLAGAGLGGVLLYRQGGSSRRRRRTDIDGVNYTDHSRVDG